MNINASSVLYSPINVQPREGVARTQPQQNIPVRESQESRRPQESPLSNQAETRKTSPEEQNRRVEASPTADSQQTAKRSTENEEQQTLFTNISQENVATTNTDDPTTANTSSAESGSDNPNNNTFNLREARPVVIEQQPSAATRTFLDVANQNDEFRIIDTFA